MFRKAAEWLGAALFAALLVTLVLQVVARLVFQQPLAWTDELAVVLLIWCLFWAAAFLVAEHEHVAIDWIINALSAAAQRWLALAVCASVSGLVAWALPACVDYLGFMAIERTAVLSLPFAWVFAPMLLWLVALALRYGWLALRLLGPHWQAALSERFVP